MEKKPMIAGLGGSLRESSYSCVALNAALYIAEANGAMTELLDVRELDLPLFVPDLPVEAYPTRYQPNITRLISVCRHASGMIWCSPTYHGTVSGAFKNAVDFLELLIDEQPPYLQGRAVALMTVPDASTFSAMADSVHELRAWLAPTRVVVKEDDFTVDLLLNNERTHRRITRLVQELLGFVQQ
ncbi:MAG: NAD(P)H-dependent oxidoreductase [Chloroflexota bacterium]|nr:NAD(P)H-dependent oxidoreductase [Chloroflexota bacterium]